MELYVDMLTQVLKETNGKATFGRVKVNADKIIKSRLYQVLNEIKAILEDYELEDEDCFHRIEDIVQAYEKVGSGCGVRHDFG